MAEKIESGEGGTKTFRYTWEVWETAKGKLCRRMKIRADSKEEAMGMLYDSEEVIAEFIRKHEKKEG